MINRSILLTLLVFITLLSCQLSTKIDESVEKAKILELHELQRKYHIEEMAQEFVAQLSADHISVNRGQITTSSRDENLQRFTDYFEAVEFESWDDITPPIVRFSDDYSLAYTIVHKEIVITYQYEDEVRQRDSTEFAWVAIYHKSGDKWEIDCVASTNKPAVSHVIVE